MTSFLETLLGERPDLASDLDDLSNLYQRKLWHQITLKLEECFRKPAFNSGDLPVRMYRSFIADFGHRLNLLKLAQLAVHVSKYFPGAPQSIEFLEGVIQRLKETKEARAEQPVLFLEMHVAQHRLESGQTSESKALVEAGTEKLQGMTDVEPSVSASVYYVASLYHKSVGDYAEFYKSSLMYLSFVSSDTLPADYKQRLAVDISLAALLGEKIYSFGLLLQHAIVDVLDATPYAWLKELLTAFHNGNMHAYDALCVKYATQLNGQPALVQNERRLREKITIMCLMELVSSLPAEDRCIPLQAIAERTKLSIDGVEFLLMKALSLHLLEGVIDQVVGTVSVSWVQPRVLTKPQIQGLRDRLDGWIDKVTAATMTLERESVGVVEV